MGTRAFTVRVQSSTVRTGRISHLLAALLGLGLLLGACFWQPDDRDASLAISATIPNLLASGGIGAQQTFSGDGMLYVYVIEENYLLLSPQELDNLFDALEDAQNLSQAELEARYPAARIRTLPINFGLGTAGSVGLTGLKGNSVYLVAVFAEACEGTYLGDYDCDGTWHEAMDFRRRALPAGETTRVSLNLDDNFDAFNDFLFAEYGFVSDEDDWDFGPGSVGFYRVYSPTTEYAVTLSDGIVTPDPTIPFGRFAWEYRGVGFDGTQDVAVFHLWWYDGASWKFNNNQAYECIEINNCAHAAGRLEELIANQGGYIHARVFVNDPLVTELPGQGFFGNAVEFMKITVPALGVSELISNVDAPNDIPNVMTGENAVSEIVQAVGQGLFPGVTTVAPVAANTVTVDLDSLTEE